MLLRGFPNNLTEQDRPPILFSTMKKYLLQVCSFDELFYRGFESDENKTFLKLKLKHLIKNTPKHRTFVFFGHEIDKASFYDYKIITLDEFWESSLKKY